MDLNGMERNGMEWNGMDWNGMSPTCARLERGERVVVRHELGVSLLDQLQVVIEVVLQLGELHVRVRERAVAIAHELLQLRDPVLVDVMELFLLGHDEVSQGVRVGQLDGSLLEPGRGAFLLALHAMRGLHQSATPVTPGQQRQVVKPSSTTAQRRTKPPRAVVVGMTPLTSFRTFGVME
jgi:hypothetical protein